MSEDGEQCSAGQCEVWKYGSMEVSNVSPVEVCV